MTYWNCDFINYVSVDENSGYRYNTVTVDEKDDEFVYKINLPGINKKDIKMSGIDNDEGTDIIIKSNIHNNKVIKSFHIPFELDEYECKMKDGLLTLIVKKYNPEEFDIEVN